MSRVKNFRVVTTSTFNFKVFIDSDFDISEGKTKQNIHKLAKVQVLGIK